MSSFTTEQIEYLESLPAVASVSGGRIHYAEQFRDECMRRYEAGESPVRIFRQAGLDPVLVGYKRIERCFARWRDGMRGEADHKHMQFDGDGVASREKLARNADAPVANSFTAVSGNVLQLVVEQQAHYIQRLETEIARLQATVGKLESRMNSR